MIVCFFLIFIVLIQSSKGAEMGAAFGGGSSQTLFGSRGAGTILTKLTTISAIVFMLTSLSLAILSINRSSIMMDAPKQEIPPPLSEQLPLKEQSTGPADAETAEAPAPSVEAPDAPKPAAPEAAPTKPAE